MENKKGSAITKLDFVKAFSKTYIDDSKDRFDEPLKDFDGGNFLHYLEDQTDDEAKYIFMSSSNSF